MVFTLLFLPSLSPHSPFDFSLACFYLHIATEVIQQRGKKTYHKAKEFQVKFVSVIILLNCTMQSIGQIIFCFALVHWNKLMGQEQL